jgi:dethiobiotin synthetase
MDEQKVMQTLFVTGTDTNVGKTYVTRLLVQKLQATGLTVGAYKPVCSGAEINSAGRPFWSDIDALQSATGKQFSDDQICPQRFLAAVAPNIAAEMEGTAVSDDLLRSGVSAWSNRVNALIVEGAGGVFCPLSNHVTVLDLATQLQAPMIVVAANRLGVISHTRLTVDRIRHSGLDVAAVVLNEVQAPNVADASLTTNARQLAHWIPDVAILHVAFRGDNLTNLHNNPSLANPLLMGVVQS